MATGPAKKLTCTKCGGALVPGSRFCNHCGAPTPATSPFEVDEDAAVSPIKPGDMLEGKWRVENKIGQGGMGSVYRCTDVALDRVVAVKVLASELCKDEVFVARFEREAKLTAGLEQPNVVLIYGVGRHLGRPFIVMKWLAGETLSSRLDEHNQKDTLLPVAEVRSIVGQICAGLDYIHKKGLVHRDIKASNIILDDEGHATILDFGILRDLKSKESLTQVGMLIGTPHYVSPEQILGKPFDARSDLYAVGVLLYEMLTGETPFDADNEFDLIKKHVKEAPPDPCARNPDLPPEVGQVLVRAIAKDPAKRYQTAQELADAFALAFAEEAETKEEDPTSPSIDLSRPLPGGPTRTISTLEQPAASGAPPRGGKGLWVGVGLGVLATVATAVIVFLNVKPEAAGPPPPPPVPIAPIGAKIPLATDRRPPKPVPGPKQPAPEDPDAVEEEYEEDDAGEEAPDDAGTAAAPDDGSGEAADGAGEPARPGLLKRAAEKDPAKLDKLRRVEP